MQIGQVAFTIDINPKTPKIGKTLSPTSSFKEVQDKLQQIINAWMVKGFFFTKEDIPTFPKYEKAISKHPLAAAFYACCFMKERWPAAEKTIAKDKEASMIYAHRLLRKRFEEGEKTISEDPEYCLAYSLLVLKRGKLPEFMHNKMLVYGIQDPENNHVKRYLRFKKVKGTT
jgi:hypothetical protein